jgi:tRNA A-37 threonylcarbamoyl transferase component Bud32
MDIIGHKINNYEVQRLIGEGGMGAVYIAQHTIIGRKAAIKVLRREFSEDTGLVSRFMNEARAAAAIGHPNIVDVVDVGNLPDGTPYMMMEFLVGEDLSKRLAKGRLSLEQTVHIALQAGSAIGAAHEKGIVHRDLKPENLFLVPDPTAPGRERVKVLDFGIAKLRGDFSGGSVKTKTGSLLGTPQYMSPEQCRGIPDGIDHRSDIYSFGIILYEMMCGAPPFVSEGLGDILLMHLTQMPDPPSLRNPELPDWMEKILLKALEKNSTDRFSSMAEFLAALESPMQASMLTPMMRQLDRTPAPVRVPTITGGRPNTWAPGLDGAANMRMTGMPQGTLSPVASNATPVTYVPIPRRGLAVGGAVAAAAVVLLVVYLLFGRGHGNETAAGPKPQITNAAPVPAVQPVAVPTPQPPPVEPKPAAVAVPTPTPDKADAEAKAAAEKLAAPSGSARSRASGRRSRPAPSVAAPAHEAPSETAEKW